MIIIVGKVLFTNPSAQAGYDTRSIFKRSLTGFEFRVFLLVGKVINQELCNKLKFDHTNKWYMHNPESVLKNEMHKLLCDFEIQTDHQILAR